MELLQIIIQVVGVFGFMLAALSLLWQYTSTCQRVSISEFEAHFITGEIDDEDKEKDIGIGLLLSFTLNNKSSRNIPITSIFLSYYGKNSPWFCKQHTNIAKTNLYNNDYSFSIYDTNLPLNVPPNYSQRISLLFCTRESNILTNTMCKRMSPLQFEALRRADNYPKQLADNTRLHKNAIAFTITLNTSLKHLIYLVPRID
jgi:hypothetical protein